MFDNLKIALILEGMNKTINAYDWIADVDLAIERHKQGLTSKKKKGMMVYIDKTTPVLVQYSDNKSFQKAKAVSRRAGQSSCLRNVLDAGGRLQ